MIVTTTPGIEGSSVSEYLGVVAAQGVLGVNVFKDVAAGQLFGPLGSETGRPVQEKRACDQGFWWWALEDLNL